MSFYITEEDQHGFVFKNTTDSWRDWVSRQVPGTIHQDIRNNLSSNLKHILVSLELKAALLRPHLNRAVGENSRLYESYAQIMNFEFCVGTYSVLEGLGAICWFVDNEVDGSNPRRFNRDNWRPSLSSRYDPQNEMRLSDLTIEVEAVRDRLHQDKLIWREQIDWHAFDPQRSFIPAITALRIIFDHSPELLPDDSPLFE